MNHDHTSLNGIHSQLEFLAQRVLQDTNPMATLVCGVGSGTQ